MNRRSFVGLVALIPVCLFTMAGCPDQATTTNISNGVTHVSKSMLGGTYTAPGGAACRWWISTSNGSSLGKITHQGNTRTVNGRRVQQKTRAADQSQTVIVSNGYLKPDQWFHVDNCGGFKKQ